MGATGGGENGWSWRRRSVRREPRKKIGTIFGGGILTLVGLLGCSWPLEHQRTAGTWFFVPLSVAAFIGGIAMLIHAAPSLAPAPAATVPPEPNAQQRAVALAHIQSGEPATDPTERDLEVRTAARSVRDDLWQIRVTIAATATWIGIAITSDSWQERLWRLAASMLSIPTVVWAWQRVRRGREFMARAAADVGETPPEAHPERGAHVEPLNQWTLERIDPPATITGVLISSAVAGSSAAAERGLNVARFDGGRIVTLEWGSSFHALSPGTQSITLSNASLLFRLTSRVTVELDPSTRPTITYIAPAMCWQRPSVSVS